MGVQDRLNIDTTPFILENWPTGKRIDKATIAQDAGRVAPLVSRTLMAQIAASGKWVPFTDETATDGSGIPSGIYDPGNTLDDIAAATLVAGDVTDVPILTTGAVFDEEKLVIENSKTLDTIIATGTVNAKTVREVLVEKNLIPQLTIAASAYENA